MKDSCSSEEEIVKRRRFRPVKKDLRSLFDEEGPEEFSEEVNVDERSTLFNEIFGTGREYLYVLEEEEEKESEEEEEEEEELSSSDCKRYVVWNLDVENKNLERFVDLLLKGYVLNFVMLHDINYDLDIYTGMKIEECVKEYKAFVEYKSKYKAAYVEDVYSWEGLKYIPKYEEIRKGYKSYGMNKYLLSVEQFETNLKDREVVFVPCRYTGEEVDFNEEEYVHQLSTSIIVRDYLIQMKKIYGEVSEEKVYRFFLPLEDEYNEKRREIIQKVISSVGPWEKKPDDRDFFNKIFDRVFNGSLKRLTPEERVVSCTREQSSIKGVVLDHRGFVLEKFKKSKNEMESFLDEIRPYCILLSGFSPSIRLVMQSLIGRNCLYVENSLFKGEKDKYDFCARIGRLALCPEIEYIRLYKEGHFEKRETVRKAILASVSITGLDLNLILSQPDKVYIISFLGLDSISKIFTVESFRSLGDLQEMIPKRVDFVNLLTYLRLFKEYSTLEEPLDETPVHFVNYSILKNDEYTTGVEEEDDITGLRITKRDVQRMKDSITFSYRPEFGGFPDSVAFENLSGSFPGILGSILEGRVFFVEEGYILVSVLNNVTVFVRTQDPHFPNQIVKVRILEANEAFVSFNGEIVPDATPRFKYPRFCKHPLYKELDSKASEEYLRDTQDLILLRRSSKDNSPILVFLFYKDIFVHYKLEANYSFRGKEYKSIDEVISLLVKPVLRKVQEISKHRHFYESEEMVDLGGDSSFIRYGFFFPKEYPGRLCFIFKNQGTLNKEYLGVYETLSYKGQSFETLDDFILYRKRAY